MKYLTKKGQGESLIKILVVAIIAIIAIAIAKSYFQKSARKTQETVEEIFELETSFLGKSILKSLTSPTSLPSKTSLDTEPP